MNKLNYCSSMQACMAIWGLTILFLSLIQHQLLSQSTTQPIFDKNYLEVEVGGFLLKANGISLSTGYQFDPLLGFGLTGSLYKDYSGVRDIPWGGWAIHYRGYYNRIIWRFDYGWNLRNLGDSDDLYTPNIDRPSNYWTLSLCTKYNNLKFGFQIGQPTIKGTESCESCTPSERDFELKPFAIVPVIGLSFGGKSKVDIDI